MTAVESRDTSVANGVVEAGDAAADLWALADWALEQRAGARTTEGRGYWRGVSSVYQGLAELAAGDGRAAGPGPDKGKRSRPRRHPEGDPPRSA